MLEVLQKILIGVFGCALIFFPIAYRMMDRIRFHGQMCVREMDDDLCRWIETSAELVSMSETGAAEIAEHARLADAYRSAKPHRTAEKISLANEIYEIVRKAALDCYGDARARALCAELDGIYSEFSILAEDYNKNAKKFNEQLDGGVIGFFGKLFRFRQEPILENLTNLKC